MATVEELMVRLAQAEAAYHNLVLGVQARVFVDQNGERIEYTPANSSRLAAYIADLRRQLSQFTLSPMKVWL